MPCVFITGASRGIGLGLAQFYARAGWSVIASCREPREAPALRRLPGTEVVKLDVTDEAAIDRVADGLSGRPIDLLFNNAGLLGPRSTPLGMSQQEDWLRILKANTVGPYLLAERIASNVLASQQRKVVNISSSQGSLTQADTEWSPMYCVSKAALNMVTRHLATLIGPRGGIVVSLSPGWVKTAMGGPEAATSVEEAVAAMAATVESLTPAENGRFLYADGSPVPW